MQLGGNPVMPTDREMRDIRRGQILDILSEPKHVVGNQQELVKLLRERGIEATQSSVSRDLRDLGVERVNGRYRISDWSYKEDPEFRRIVELIDGAHRSGPHLLVVQTTQGAAKAVAVAIERAKWPEVRGVLAGETTIFVATDSQQDQTRLLQRFKTFLIPNSPS
jgi:transcriptional regulator of arginine metabolism